MWEEVLYRFSRVGTSTRERHRLSATAPRLSSTRPIATLALVWGSISGTWLTGSWAILTGALILGGVAFPVSLGCIGTLEFVGPNEPLGWSLAGRIVPVAYIA